MKNFFNTKSLRERLLMLAFLLIGVLWWGSALTGRVKGNVDEWRAAGRDAELQQMWLSQKDAISARTAAAASQLDAARTMSASQAYAEINRLAQGLPVDMSGQRTEGTENFAIHSVGVTFRRVDMAGLLRFYESVVSRAPYVGIEECTISADQATPGMVTAFFRVYAVEAVRPAKP